MAGEIQWFAGEEDALREAKESARPILIDFHKQA